ncbi:HD domain-containing protein [Cellulosilyticum sp. I15G10I2]|uniref:HD domain-containing protein n=1 Tax=Cellulosilyticum sp. I15G10I2 TaxID=1892843 RepID=UPI00085CB492|nr:HD domain-containing protein [Cellulosilyticum sp. I15G10I2]
MERFNQLIKDEGYLSYLNKNSECEKTRIFCKHDYEHFWDVARIAYMLVLENRYPKVSKEIIYTCAFLHDIGRWQEYTLGIPHEQASWELARPLLEKYHFSTEEQQEISQGILGHRKGSEDILGELMYHSDKLSRRCYDCKAHSQCHWPIQNRNMTIIY